jgi:serine/threonine protein kinase
MKIHKRGLKECLKAEIKALAGLQHPHVIRLVGCAEEEGKCLYLMERMDKSLSKMLEDCSLSLVQRVDMMLQIAEGVRYLHSKNLVHRDLKPENILVKHDNSGPETLMLAPLVEDFWIAKVSDFGTMKEKMESMAYVGQTMNVGTTMFMAPEMYQLEDSAKRPERFHPMKTDVYSFALICFVVLTSESTPFPFEELMNPSVREFKDRVRRGKRPKLPANCPVDLSDLIQQCWDGNQDGRPNFDYICTELRQIKDFLLTGMVISP